MQMNDTSIVRTSANGTTSHTPFTPRYFGSISIPIMKNMNVLSNDSVADIFPFENAVNIPDENMLIPATSIEIENIINPLSVTLNKLLSLAVNNDINISEQYIDVIKTMNPNIAEIIKLYFTSFFS